MTGSATIQHSTRPADAPSAHSVHARRRNAILYACLFASGFVGLAYEIAWIRTSSLVLGSAGYALSTVLAVFFGGLALGSYLFGRMSRTTTRPLTAYATIEVVLGILAGATPLLFGLADAVYGWAYPSIWQQLFVLTSVRVGIVAVVLLPPAVLMGGTLPLICRHFITQQQGIAGRAGILYALNTLGAAAGCAVTGFLLIPLVGVSWTIYLGALVNLAIGAIVFRLADNTPRTTPYRAAVDERATQADGTSYASHIVYALFFFSGFVLLANENVWARFLSLLMANTVHTYTWTLFLILVGIVIGSGLASLLLMRLRRRAFAFGLVQVLSGLAVLLVLLAPATSWRSVDGAQTNRITAFLIMLLLPSVLSGIAFPLAIGMVVKNPALAGAGVGNLAAVSTLGGILGSLSAGFAFLPGLGIQQTILICTGVSLLIGLAACVCLETGRWRIGGTAVGIAAVAIWFGYPRMTGIRLPHALLADPATLVDVKEGIGSNLAVIDNRGVLTLEIDRWWQGENRKNHQIVAAHVPMMLHGSPKRVACVGIGTGQTASRFLMYDIESLDSIDIEPALPGLVRRHFDAAWMDDPRSEIVIEDGRNFLTHTDRTYDVISIEIGQTFRPGVTSFYTVEFYERARDRLAPDGVLSQFVPLAFLTVDDFRTVLRTFMEIFPNSVLWYNSSELLLIGATSDKWQVTWNDVFEQLNQPVIHDDLSFAYWGGQRHQLHHTDVFLAGYLCGPQQLAAIAGDAPIYHDERPTLEYSAAAVREPSEPAVIDLLREHLADPASLLLGTIEPGRLAFARQIRERNLGDIVAANLFRVAENSAQGMDSASRRAMLQSAVEWNPDHVRARRLLGSLDDEAGRLDEAIQSYAEVVRIAPESADDKLILSGLLAKAGRSAQADAVALDTVSAHPEDAKVLYEAGLVHARRGEFEQAVAKYEQAVQSQPDFTQAHVNLAVALTRLQRFDDALSHYHKAIELDPTLVNAHYNLSILLGRMERRAEAEEAAQQAIRADANFAPAYNQLGTLLMRRNAPAEAAAAFGEAVRIQPDFAAAHFNYGLALMRLDKAAEAAVQFEQTLQIDPGHSRAKAKLAEARAKSAGS